MESDSERLPINVPKGESNIPLVSIFETYVRPCIAEFVGVSFFVFIGTMVVQDSSGLPDKDFRANAVAIALCHGMTIAVLVIALGSISGAHVNPAVTLAIAICGEIKPLLAVCYFFSQIVGGMVGAAFTRAVLPDSMYTQFGGGAHDLATTEHVGEAILCEMLLTTVLVLVILLVAVDPRTKTELAPLAIGMAVTVDIFAGIFVTGASMNPARSFGPAIAMTVFKNAIWKHHYVYWIGPALGSILAALIYKLGLGSASKRLILKEE
ncbi:hypothetical protein LOTGIDRAFT_156476 [Lottia gigantea]|uniref:Aquaporin n=1 Tax=Lottia gigantea TaxID=225164 RepID=V4AIJ5_LOTGI|nr:hypothetical protein LOTGIDRAFT_156476 [Lottia gigantea]ESP03879.1 hypothetical protein LOTGIDRAFT_156476 [Lottia gigantea]